MTAHDIALVGCGGVTKMHFDGYAAHPDEVRVVAACDPLPERREWAEQTYGVGRTFATLEEMIAGADWDVAVVCTPTHLRRETLEALAAAGKHVLVEKPLADNYTEAEQIVKACRKAGVQLAVNQNFRDHYAFGVAAPLVADGRIGAVHGVSHFDVGFRQDRGWRIKAERHALSVMGVHWFDGFRQILQREATSVWCHTSSSPAVDCVGETDAFCQLLFDHIPVTYVQSFSSRLRRAETIVFGEKGTLRLGYDGVTLSGPEGQSEEWTNPYAKGAKPESAYRSLDRLLRALGDGGQPSNSGEDNLKTIALLDAAYVSAQSESPVKLVGGLPQ